jgi:hypothetical protein
MQGLAKKFEKKQKTAPPDTAVSPIGVFLCRSASIIAMTGKYEMYPEGGTAIDEIRSLGDPDTVIGLTSLVLEMGMIPKYINLPRFLGLY